MRWIYELYDIKAEPFKEPLLDCGACRVKEPLVRVEQYSKELKCCQFTPFWSGFAVGAWMQRGGHFLSLMESIQATSVLTVFGVMHRIEQRQQSGGLCQFFDKKTTACQIWSNRPGTCASFFCASQYKNGLKTYSAHEEVLLGLEAKMLEAWFFAEVADPLLWEHWCEYMDGSTPIAELNPALIITNEQAGEHYQKLFTWLQLEENKKVKEAGGRHLQKQLEEVNKLC